MFGQPVEERSSKSWKKRFSVFNSDVSDEVDAGGEEAVLLMAQDDVSQVDSRAGQTHSDVWFDVAMNFCSEMDLPVREDVDEDIVKEAQHLMKEEGR